MTREQSAYLILIIVAFLTFAATLLWAMLRSSGLRPTAPDLPPPESKRH